MKKHQMVAAALLIGFCLNGCAERTVSQPAFDGKSYDSVQSESASRSETDKTVLTSEEKAAIIESGELLTKALARCIKGFSTNTVSAPSLLNAPSAEDTDSIHQILILLAFYQGDAYEHSIYADRFYRDKEGIYHLSEEGIVTVLQDVLGISTWDASAFPLDFDESAQGYLSDLAFGVGYPWECEQILDCAIDKDAKRLSITYKVESLFPEASENGDDVTSWTCENTFSVCRRNNGQVYLSLEKCEIL